VGTKNTGKISNTVLTDIFHFCKYRYRSKYGTGTGTKLTTVEKPKKEDPSSMNKGTALQVKNKGVTLLAFTCRPRSTSGSVTDFQASRLWLAELRELDMSTWICPRNTS
jgi:hypothetical protein